MRILTAALLLCLAVPAFPAPVEDQLREFVANHPEGGEIEDKLALPNGCSLRFVFECTSKGNGVLTLGGVRVHVYDAHDDGAYFEEGFLRITTEQRANRVTVIFSGEALLTEEKGGKISRRESVKVILSTDQSGRLHLISQSEGAIRLNVVRT